MKAFPSFSAQEMLCGAFNPNSPMCWTTPRWSSALPVRNSMECGTNMLWIPYFGYCFPLCYCPGGDFCCTLLRWSETVTLIFLPGGPEREKVQWHRFRLREAF